MMFALDFLPEVNPDVKETYNWYEEQLPGLGEDFFLSVEAAVNAVQRNPLLNAEIYKGIRRIKTKRFPYGIFYLLNGNIITVIAIVHLSRHPRTWKNRMRGNRKKR